MFNWPWDMDSVVWVYLIPKFIYPPTTLFCRTLNKDDILNL